MPPAPPRPCRSCSSSCTSRDYSVRYLELYDGSTHPSTIFSFFSKLFNKSFFSDNFEICKFKQIWCTVKITDKSILFIAQCRSSYSKVSFVKYGVREYNILYGRSKMKIKLMFSGILFEINTMWFFRLKVFNNDELISALALYRTSQS